MKAYKAELPEPRKHSKRRHSMNEIERGIDLLQEGAWFERISPSVANEIGYEIGVVCEFARAALREQTEREKLLQWLDDIDNPLEPIKIESALRSEMMKLEFRRDKKPEDVSILDYTIIAALAEALKSRLEVEP